MPNQPTYHSQVWDHLGLVAGMFDELGLGDVIDQATRQNPAMRDRTVGEAVNAMVRKGLGCINQALSLVPRVCHHQPTYRRIAPRVTPAQRNDDALGRALDTLDADGVTERSRLLAVSAATRRGRCPTDTPLDTTSVHVDGRDHSDEAPAAQVVPSTTGSSREHRPDLNQVMLALMVEHQAGIPLLMTPLRGHSRAPHTVGQAIRAPSEPWHTVYGATYVVADRALYREANLDTLAQTALKWSTRVPATLSAAQAALAHADPQALAARPEGYRDHELTSTYGGVEQRGVLRYSEPRRVPAQRPIDTQLRQPRAQAVTACKTCCRTTLACAADARQALSAFEQGVPATVLTPSTVRAQPCDGKRGRPGRDAQPDHVASEVEGALAASLTARQALVDQHRCCILATTERDATLRPPQEVWHGDNGQVPAERGCRFLNDPQFFASSRYRKKPERIMALLMVMTVCVLVYAALAYRIRQALNDQEATFPDHKGQRIQHPTARWVLHYLVGIHLRCQAGQWPIVLNLTEAQQHLLRLLGPPYMRLYDVRYS
jgi:transposase